MCVDMLIAMFAIKWIKNNLFPKILNIPPKIRIFIAQKILNLKENCLIQHLK